jgi:membrane associated rhomboid family serine protease
MAIELKQPQSAKRAAIEVYQEVKAQGLILGSFVGTLWAVEAIDWVLRGALDGFGVVPRTAFGLIGIFLAPFLHGGFPHLIANTVPLVALSFFIMLRRKRDLFYVSGITTVIAGLGTWLIGASNSVHIGASGLVFGYLGYLMSRGIFERKVWSILGSLAVFLLYGGALFGVLPGQPGISWEMHLFGFIGGVVSAKWLARKDVVTAVEKKAVRRLPA